ncbi:MAG: ATP-binding protein, partial [Caulobacterales bacterium]
SALTAPWTSSFRRGAAYRGPYLEATAPVMRDGQTYGAVFLRAGREPLLVRLGRHAPVGLLMIMAALVLFVSGAAQSALSKANAELQARANELTTTNARLEAEMEQRKLAEESLLQSRKMEAIGQLTGGVAHDFNNLLMVISGGLRLLEKQSDQPERRRKTTDAMNQAVERGAGLTRQLLAFARRESLELKTIDVAQQLSGMSALLERSLRADVLLEVKLPSDLPPIKTDPGKFELAILNLCVNARDAMPKGGLLTITAHTAATDKSIVEVIVKDTGTGIPPDVLERIFEPYFTTKQVGHGTGLGLAQVYGFARQNGGSVRIETKVNAGTSVILSLPVSDEALASEPQQIEQRQSPTQPRSILVVEDDDQVAVTVGAMLEELGHRYIRASSAAEALQVLQQERDFDIVFSDIIMPGGKSGIELADELEKSMPEMPVLLTTGYSGRGDVTVRRPLLRKPYLLDELREAIASVARAS